MRLPENFSTMTVKELLEMSVLVPRKVAIFYAREKMLKSTEKQLLFIFQSKLAIVSP